MSAAKTPAVLIERFGNVLLVTINRPESSNAIDLEASVLIGEAVEELDCSNSLQSLVLTGSGNRAFCAGGDLKAVARGEPIVQEGHEAWGFAGFTTHFTSKITIAAVNGAALGGGFELVLASDLVVASANATFGLPDVKLGGIAGAGGLIRLPSQMPRRVALHMILTGAPIDAREAHMWGLVNAVTDQKSMVERAIELAENIGRNAPLAIAASKRVFYGVSDDVQSPEQLLWQINARETAPIKEWKDWAEGLDAYEQGRPPKWRGE